MTAERDSMTLNEVSYSALGASSLRSSAPRADRARPTPDPEVVAKPKRRQFSAEYRLRILEEAERCTQRGELDTIDQMRSVVSGLVGRGLLYRTLIADNGPDSGAR